VAARSAPPAVVARSGGCATVICLDTSAIRQLAPDRISPAHAWRQSLAAGKSRLKIVFEGPNLPCGERNLCKGIDTFGEHSLAINDDKASDRDSLPAERRQRGTTSVYGTCQDVKIYQDHPDDPACQAMGRAVCHTNCLCGSGTGRCFQKPSADGRPVLTILRN
jgi:hypothetical protein